jgi:hypothetical protein
MYISLCDTHQGHTSFGSTSELVEWFLVSCMTKKDKLCSCKVLVRKKRAERVTELKRFPCLLIEILVLVWEVKIFGSCFLWCFELRLRPPKLIQAKKKKKKKKKKNKSAAALLPVVDAKKSNESIWKSGKISLSSHAFFHILQDRAPPLLS